MAETLFFWVSKIVWLLIRPEAWILILAGLSAIFAWRGRVKATQRSATGLFAILVVFATLPVDRWLLSPLENRYPANPTLTQVDGIIVLGGDEGVHLSPDGNQPTVGSVAERPITGAALHRAFPSARLVHSGGSGDPAAQLDLRTNQIPNLYAQLGVPAGSFTHEASSRNTLENARRSFDLVVPAEGEIWVLVTSASHMPRSVAAFCAVGWDIIPYPVDFRSSRETLFSKSLLTTMDRTNIALREWVGLVAYRITRQTNILFPSGNCGD